MNVSRLEIVNFKQFRGLHEVTIPTMGTIGVIGRNGVGKTTLFQAIEWALYGASATSNDSVAPRNTGGESRVTVTLDMADSAEQYVVERTMRKRTQSASVYRVDPNGELSMIVKGTSATTEYIRSTLIGLDHKSFTATFFTRQKELSFFGNYGETERRREISRLLGLEIIETAQATIRDQARQALDSAKVQSSQYESAAKDRNFELELRQADDAVTAATAALTEAGATVDLLTGQLTETQDRWQRLQRLKDEDSALATRLMQHQAERHRATERRDVASAELERLDRQAADRVPLAETVANLPNLAEQVRSLAGQKQRHDRQLQLRELIREITRRRADTVSQLSALLTGITPPTPLAGWTWQEADVVEPDQAADRAAAATQTVDLAALQNEATQLARARQLADDQAREAGRLQQFRARRSQIDTELATLLADGDPDATLTDLVRQRDELGQQESRLAADLRQLTTRLERNTSLAAKLRQFNFDEVCPTCQRPFRPDDAQIALTGFADEEQDIRRQMHDGEQQLTVLRARLGEIRTATAQQQSRGEQKARLQASIAASMEPIAQQEAAADRAANELAQALQAAGRHDAPEESELRAVQADITGWQRVVDSRPQLVRIGRSIRQIAEELAPLQAELAAIGEVAYDATRHQETALAYETSLQARARLEELDRQLARRPEFLAAQETADVAIAAANAAIAAVTSERSALGFIPDELAQEQLALSAARDAREVAIEQRHRQEQAVLREQSSRDQLAAEHRRIAKLATDAEREHHRHDTLSRMVNEFTEFQRYAVEWYTPRLSDLTSELVTEVTNGRYDHVEFDNNFGIRIYDGPDESFPLETFSGGERDAIALCARIALSRVIGGTGTQPPGFLVLDEVFGSLDFDRRTRLLDMLGKITQMGDHFHQVFIISHVDDVRTSPIFDELWQIDENDEGSVLTTLEPGAEIGEL